MEINVRFVCQNDDCAEVKLPGETIVEDALEQLVEAGILEALQSGNEWQVYFKESGKAVDTSKSMDENGVVEGTTLRVSQTATFGA